MEYKSIITDHEERQRWGEYENDGQRDGQMCSLDSRFLEAIWVRNG